MFTTCNLFFNFSKVCLLKRTPKTCFLTRICHFSLSFHQKNHYDTLQLSKSCTKKEIRDAFISLSKKYHPDKNKNNPKAQEQFVKINEAYNVLIKAESRRDYDFNLQHFGEPSKGYRSPNKNEYYEVRREDSHYRDPWKDPYFARNRDFWRDKHSNTNDENYYGVKGMKKMTNDRLLFWIVMLAGVGLFLQIMIIRIAAIRSYSTYDRVSQQNKEYLKSVQERAELYGSRERQLEEYKIRAEIKDEK